MHGIPSTSGEAVEGTRDVLDAVRHLVRALRLGNLVAERRVGLSSAQLFVLHSLGTGEALSLKEVAAQTATDQSSVSVVVGRLVERGLVSRKRSPEDRRRLELALTTRGRALLARAPRRLVQHDLVLAIERMPLADRRGLARLLARLVATMAGVSGVPEMFFEPRRQLQRRRNRKTAHGS